MRLSARNLSRANIRRLNRLLVPQGRKMCITCGGNHPLDDEHWYWCYDKRTDKTYSSARCRGCKRVSDAQRTKTVYHDNPTFRAAAIKRSGDWQRSHPAEAKAHAAAKRRRRKIARLKVVMYGND